MIVIIGNGISGVTAARHIRKRSDETIAIISSESKYFFSRTALMYVYMGHMKFEHTQPYEDDFWEKNNINLIQAHIDHIDTDSKSLRTSKGKEISYHKLIIASGSKPNKFGWKNQDAQGVQGLYSKQDLEAMETNTKDIDTAVVVGGGLIGIEMVEMLLSRNINVHFLIRETFFWDNVLPERDARFVMKHIEKHHGLILHYEDELDEVLTNNNKAIGVKTKNGHTIDCQFVGLTTGVSPNIEFVKASKIECNRGILVNRFLETNVKDVYAIGDCVESTDPYKGRRAIEQVWYTGKFMGETIAKTITSEPTAYTPGNWFNSAKFFDIEYQTYGMVGKVLEEDQDEFIYEHPSKEVFLHFVFERESHILVGVNNFGIRLRHLVFNEWLNTKATIQDVLVDLKSANFDPEFFKTYEADILGEFNEQFGENLSLNKRKWWQTILAK